MDNDQSMKVYLSNGVLKNHFWSPKNLHLKLLISRFFQMDFNAEKKPSRLYLYVVSYISRKHNVIKRYKLY